MDWAPTAIFFLSLHVRQGLSVQSLLRQFLRCKKKILLQTTPEQSVQAGKLTAYLI